MDAFYILTLSVAAFVFLHTGVSATPLRRSLIGKSSDGLYRAVFSGLSLILIILIWTSYGDARLSPENALLWTPPAFFRHIGHLIMLAGILIAVAGYLAMNPTAMAMGGALKNDDPAVGASRVTRHPFLIGVTLWAIAHLLNNGELVAVILFGGFLITALAGMASIDRKLAIRDPDGFERLKAVTSITPFAAIITGRNRFAFGELWWRFAIGGAVFAALWWAHGAIFGVYVS